MRLAWRAFVHVANTCLAQGIFSRGLAWGFSAGDWPGDFSWSWFLDFSRGCFKDFSWAGLWIAAEAGLGILNEAGLGSLRSRYLAFHSWPALRLH